MSICFGNSLNNSDLKDNRSKFLQSYINNEENFNITMIETLCSWDTPCCFISSIPLFYPCTQTYIRYTVLNQVYPTSNWDNYICCQGYFPKFLCFNPHLYVLLKKFAALRYGKRTNSPLLDLLPGG